MVGDEALLLSVHEVEERRGHRSRVARGFLWPRVLCVRENTVALRRSFGIRETLPVTSHEMSSCLFHPDHSSAAHGCSHQNIPSTLFSVNSILVVAPCSERSVVRGIHLPGSIIFAFWRLGLLVLALSYRP